MRMIKLLITTLHFALKMDYSTGVARVGFVQF